MADAGAGTGVMVIGIGWEAMRSGERGASNSPDRRAAVARYVERFGEVHCGCHVTSVQQEGSPFHAHRGIGGSYAGRR